MGTLPSLFLGFCYVDMEVTGYSTIDTG
jgi:hypothetical protein